MKTKIMISGVCRIMKAAIRKEKTLWLIQACGLTIRILIRVCLLPIRGPRNDHYSIVRIVNLSYNQVHLGIGVYFGQQLYENFVGLLYLLDLFHSF